MNRNLYRKKILVGCLGVAFMLGVCSCGENNTSGTAGINMENAVKSEQETEDRNASLEEISEGISVEVDGDNRLDENVEYIDASEVSTENSFWYEGIEFKVLKYVDKENMLVKFLLGDYMIQAIVPRSLEEEPYICEYVTEYYSGEQDVYLKLTNPTKQNAVYFAYVQGEQNWESFEDLSLEGIKEEMGLDNDAYEFFTVEGRTGVIAQIYDYASWSEYDHDEVDLPGYCAIVHDEDEKMIFIMEVLNEEEKAQDKITKYLEQIAFRGIGEADFVSFTAYSEDELKKRVDSLYEEYVEIIYSPDKVLQEQYEAVGSEYQWHCLKDITGDGIPEIVFFGNPGTVCIIGEENAVSIGAREIFWTNDYNIFYSKYAFGGVSGYSKCEVLTDASGMISINIIEGEYLEWDNENGYSYMGKTIAEEEYNQKVSEIESPKMPHSRFFDADEIYAGKGSFYRVAECMVDGYIY